MSGNLARDIRTLSLNELESFFAGRDEKPFRARQVHEWLWKKSCRSFEEMTNLSNKTRQLLCENFSFNITRIDETQKSSDGTIKAIFRLSDDLLTEGVIIPAGNRATACISSQAGCPLGCHFCATGLSGFLRNLTAGEIFEQVVLLSRLSGNSLSNIVFMGMGEPLLNWTEVKTTIQKLTSDDGLAISPRRITVSTVGIPGTIHKIADEGVNCHLALSLHAATDEKRSRIIPVSKKYPLEKLIAALKYYYSVTKKRFTVEYILFKDFNDSLKDAGELAAFCKNFPVKVNIIEYNPVENSEFMATEPVKVISFIEFLERKNMIVNLRKSRGRDIEAACGQLAVKSYKK